MPYQDLSHPPGMADIQTIGCKISTFISMSVLGPPHPACAITKAPDALPCTASARFSAACQEGAHPLAETTCTLRLTSFP